MPGELGDLLLYKDVDRTEGVLGSVGLLGLRDLAELGPGLWPGWRGEWVGKMSVCVCVCLPYYALDYLS